MTPTAYELSAAAGGTIDYAMQFPEEAGEDLYILLMGYSGTGPTTFGVPIPLTVDPLVAMTAQGNLGGAILQTGFRGQLSSSAAATATLGFPPGLLSPFVGLEFQLAAIAFDPGSLPQYSSVAVRLTIDP